MPQHGDVPEGASFEAPLQSASNEAPLIWFVVDSGLLHVFWVHRSRQLRSWGRGFSFLEQSGIIAQSSPRPASEVPRGPPSRRTLPDPVRDTRKIATFALSLEYSVYTQYIIKAPGLRLRGFSDSEPTDLNSGLRQGRHKQGNFQLCVRLQGPFSHARHLIRTRKVPSGRGKSHLLRGPG
jgi:hypothetical protein